MQETNSRWRDGSPMEGSPFVLHVGGRVCECCVRRKPTAGGPSHCHHSQKRLRSHNDQPKQKDERRQQYHTDIYDLDCPRRPTPSANTLRSCPPRLTRHPCQCQQCSARASSASKRQKPKCSWRNRHNNFVQSKAFIKATKHHRN
eukprot:7729236-Alexandrium_andersonii.AAC.2